VIYKFANRALVQSYGKIKCLSRSNRAKLNWFDRASTRLCMTPSRRAVPTLPPVHACRSSLVTSGPCAVVWFLCVTHSGPWLLRCGCSPPADAHTTILHWLVACRTSRPLPTARCRAEPHVGCLALLLTRETVRESLGPKVPYLFLYSFI
jgi:hypothetical protein